VRLLALVLLLAACSGESDFHRACVAYAEQSRGFSAEDARDYCDEQEQS
jgi:hypothetical protein